MSKAEELKYKYCKKRWDIEKDYAQAELDFEELWTKIKKFFKFFFSKQNPLLGPLAALGAELLGAIAAAAAGLVGSLFALASAALKKVMEKIFGLLLTIMMMGPDALLSMLILPMSRARKANEDEAVAISEIASSLGVCMSIMRKWLEKTSSNSEQYLQQMQAAIGTIKIVLENFNKLLTSLDKNAFDEEAYNNAMQALDFSIFLTQPSSATSRTLDINGRMDVIEQQIFSEKIAEIDIQRSKELADNDVKYRTRTDPYYAAQKDVTHPDFYTTTNNAIDPKLLGYVADWEYQKKAINLKYDGKELSAKAQAKAEAYKEISQIFTDIGDDLKDEFDADVIILKEQTSNMITAIGDATLKNKESQAYTQASYNGISKIKNAIAWMIELMNGNSFGASSIARASVRVGTKMVDKAKARLETRVKSYYDGKRGNAFNAGSIIDLTFSNTQLHVARLFMDGAITQQMINMLNFDEELEAQMTGFLAFQDRVYSIPDWDNSTGKWGVSPTSLFTTTSPYISLVGDVIKMSTSIFVPDGTRKSIALMSNIDKKINDIANHNQYVSGVLYSWNPPINGESEELRKTLEQFGGVMAQYFMLLDFAAFFGSKALEGLKEAIELSKISDLDDCNKLFEQFTKDAETSRSMSPALIAKMKDGRLKTINNVNSASKIMTGEDEIKAKKEQLVRFDFPVMDRAMDDKNGQTINSDMTGMH